MVFIIAVDNGEDDDSVEYRAYDGNGAGLSAWKAKGLLTMVSDNVGVVHQPREAAQHVAEALRDLGHRRD